MRSWLGRLRAYSAIFGMAPRLFVAYRAWFWMALFVQILALAIFVYFWRAVYGDRESLGGLTRQQTLNYIMLAQVVLPLVTSQMVFHFGERLVDGQFAMELLRPLDLQARYYTEALGLVLVNLLHRVPLLLFAWLVFDLRLPADPLTWGAFLVTLLLGHAVLFCFEWLFSCLAFYTTESWGLAVVQNSVAAFFSGALIPLTLMPAWLERLTLSLPFAQALWVPVSILSGITPLAEVPRLWLIQLLWLIGMLLASRLVFRVSVRKVTVLGG
jgi:ABC-2 type transport system permease protein